MDLCAGDLQLVLAMGHCDIDDRRKFFVITEIPDLRGASLDQPEELLLALRRKLASSGSCKCNHFPCSAVHAYLHSERVRAQIPLVHHFVVFPDFLRPNMDRLCGNVLLLQSWQLGGQRYLSVTI